MNIDIFLIDWEKPRRYDTNKPVKTTMRRQQSFASASLSDQIEDVITETRENPVSIWRTYAVANEWNEIQVRVNGARSLELVH